MAHGGKRAGAGRKPGKVSAAKRTLAEMAAGHADAAMKALADIAKDGDSEGARVSAAIAILDRAYGKPPIALHHSGPNGGPIQTLDATALSTDALRELMAAMNGKDADPDASGSAGD